MGVPVRVQSTGQIELLNHLLGIIIITIIIIIIIIQNHISVFKLFIWIIVCLIKLLMLNSNIESTWLCANKELLLNRIICVK